MAALAMDQREAIAGQPCPLRGQLEGEQMQTMTVGLGQVDRALCRAGVIERPAEQMGEQGLEQQRRLELVREGV